MFKIKSTETPDDYQSMREVIYRRIENYWEEQEKGLRPPKAKFSPLPDLILLDGGEGHVNTVCEMLRSLDITIPVFGMVKNNRHKTSDLVNEAGERIGLSQTGILYPFVGGIQEEVHRFAISYHKKLRSKKQLSSPLDSIRGLGPARKKALMKRFGSFKNICNAQASDLKLIKGITEEIVAEIKKLKAGENK